MDADFFVGKKAVRIRVKLIKQISIISGLPTARSFDSDIGDCACGPIGAAFHYNRFGTLISSHPSPKDLNDETSTHFEEK